MLDNDEDARALAVKQAAEWFVRLREGEFSELEYRCYLHWLAESPAHVAALFPRPSGSSASSAYIDELNTRRCAA